MEAFTTEAVHRRVCGATGRGGLGGLGMWGVKSCRHGLGIRSPAVHHDEWVLQDAGVHPSTCFYLFCPFLLTYDVKKPWECPTFSQDNNDHSLALSHNT